MNEHIDYGIYDSQYPDGTLVPTVKLGGGNVAVGTIRLNLNGVMNYGVGFSDGTLFSENLY